MNNYKTVALNPGARAPFEAMAAQALEDVQHDLAAIVAFDRLRALLPEIEADAVALDRAQAEAAEARDRLADKCEAERVKLVELRAELEKLPERQRYSDKANGLRDEIMRLERQRANTNAKLTAQSNRTAQAQTDLRRMTQALERLRAIELPEIPTLAILRQALTED